MRASATLSSTWLPRVGLAVVAFVIATSNAQAGLLTVGSADWQQFEGSNSSDQTSYVPPWSMAADPPEQAPGFRGASCAGGAVLVVRREENKAWTPAVAPSRSGLRISVRSSDELRPLTQRDGRVFRPPEGVCSEG